MEKIYSAHEILTDPRGQRQMYILLHQSINGWARFNTRLLRAFPNVLQIGLDLKEIHAKWLTSFIVDYPVWGEMKVFGNIRTCPAVQMFTELSRTHFIIMYPKIRQENDTVAQNGEYTNDAFIISYRMDMCEYLEGPWTRPIMMYKQEDIMNALLMLTEKIDQLPMDAIEEVKKTLEVLYTRNSVFLCESSNTDILNVEGMRTPLPGAEDDSYIIPSRHYITFCTIYFHAIQRRIFFYEQINKRYDKKIPQDVIDRIQHWIVELVDALGAEGFEDCHAKASEEAYNFPGDREWFKYRYPDLPAQTGAILDCFRKEYAKRYFTEYRVSKESVLGAVNQTSHMGHAARIFVLNAVDQYMKTQFNFPWRDGIVIDNDAIEGAQVQLFRNKTPYLLQVFSRYWVYDDATVYPCDNLYETLAIWMYILKHRYKSTVFSISIDRLISKIIDDEQKKTFTAIF